VNENYFLFFLNNALFIFIVCVQPNTVNFYQPGCIIGKEKKEFFVRAMKLCGKSLRRPLVHYINGQLYLRYKLAMIHNSTSLCRN